jgi:hypothetical protein
MLIILEWPLLKTLVLLLWFIFNETSLLLQRIKFFLSILTLTWSFYAKGYDWGYLFAKIIYFLLLFWLKSLKTISWKESLPWSRIYSEWFYGNRIDLLTTVVLDLLWNSRGLILKFPVDASGQLFLMFLDGTDCIICIFFHSGGRFILSTLFFLLKLPQVLL